MTAIHQGLAQTKVGDLDIVHLITLAEYLRQQQKGLRPVQNENKFSFCCYTSVCVQIISFHTSVLHNTHLHNHLLNNTQKGHAYSAKGYCSAHTLSTHSFQAGRRAYQEVIWLDITMQGVGAVHTLDGCNDLPQYELGGVQAEDQPLPVAALEPAGCLPATTRTTIQTCQGPSQDSSAPWL